MQGVGDFMWGLFHRGQFAAGNVAEVLKKAWTISIVMLCMASLTHKLMVPSTKQGRPICHTLPVMRV